MFRTFVKIRNFVDKTDMLTPKDKEVHIKQVFSELDRKFEEEEAQQKAFEERLPYINLYGFPIDHGALSIIPKEQAEQTGGIVFFKESRNIKVGVVAVTDEVKKLLKDLSEQGYFVEVFFISQSSFNHTLPLYSRLVGVKPRSTEIVLKTDPKALVTLKEKKPQLTTISATQLLELILTAALVVDASDIHLEPQKEDLKMRFRLDGVLQDISSLAKEAQLQLTSRIKILSKLKLNVTSTPQDGSFHLTYNNSAVDIRVSVLPSAFGESIVLRILRQDKESLKFEELGITGLANDRILAEMEKPNGMILTTGPTGSGKTTTLYAILNKLNEPGVKIITIEDPVEYKIPGITQTPIDAAAGMTFASALRAILRQDPDVVMVGEMRDLETAETAAQAALTGHIVLSTLHTNDAAGAIPRLIDLGVKPFVLAPAINVIIAQRLLRRICQQCKETYELDKHLRQRVELILSHIPKSAKVEVASKLTFYHSKGCGACHGLGYKGRVGVYEVFAINDAIEKLILKGATTNEIKTQAVADGMITMAQDGLLKALQGVTDVEEVFRVTEE